MQIWGRKIQTNVQIKLSNRDSRDKWANKANKKTIKRKLKLRTECENKNGHNSSNTGSFGMNFIWMESSLS